MSKAQKNIGEKLDMKKIKLYTKAGVIALISDINEAVFLNLWL